MWTVLISQLQSDGHSSSDQDSSLDRWRVCSYPELFSPGVKNTTFHSFIQLILWYGLFKGTRSALAVRDVSNDADTFLQNLEALLTWVCEIEELTANQKPPSSEIKVVKAQLQEQKVCLSPKSSSPQFSPKKHIWSAIVEGIHLKGLLAR